MTCGDPGSVRDVCWNGSPYQPVPVATDVAQERRPAGARAARGLPRRARRAAERPLLPARPSASTSPTCWATSARSPRTSTTSPPSATTAPSTVPRSSAGPAWRSSTTSGCAACPATGAWRSTRWAGCWATTRSSRARPATPSSPRSTPRCRRSSSSQLAERIAFQRTQLDTVTGRKYVADSGAAVVLDAKTGRVVAMASQPTYDPDVWTGGISEEQLDPALLREGRHAAALARDAGPVRPGLDVEAVHDRRRPDQRLLDGHHAAVLLGLPGRQPRLQELRVRRLRQHRLRQGARGLLQHVLLPRRLRLLAALRLRPRRRRRQGPAGRGGQGVRLRLPHRHRPAR